MKALVFALLYPLLAVAALAQTPDPSQYDVATSWPSVHYQITVVQRIPGNRLLVAVRLYGKGDAPPTLIGVQVAIPANATQPEVAAGLFRPKPFSISGATMTEEITKQTYTTLAPAPNSTPYLSPDVLLTLHAGESQVMTIQFPAPPPPDPSSGIDPKHQTVSILLPKAVKAVTGIVLPPPAPVAAQ